MPRKLAYRNWSPEEKEKQKAHLNSLDELGQPKWLRPHLKHKYKLSLERYLEMVEEQENVCAICGRTTETRLYVDHDHETGKVRGLLCQACNCGLGMFRDDFNLLKTAMEYLING